MPALLSAAGLDPQMAFWLAVLGIGLFGLTGEMLFDDVRVEAVSP